MNLTVERKYEAKIRNEAGELVGFVYSEPLAKMLEAAPLLVGALREALHYGARMPDDWVVAAGAALAKAEGR